MVRFRGVLWTPPSLFAPKPVVSALRGPGAAAPLSAHWSSRLPGQCPVQQPGVADLLAEMMADGRSILVSGATHTGKTTVLGALLAS